MHNFWLYLSTISRSIFLPSALMISLSFFHSTDDGGGMEFILASRVILSPHAIDCEDFERLTIGLSEREYQWSF